MDILTYIGLHDQAARQAIEVEGLLGEALPLEQAVQTAKSAAEAIDAEVGDLKARHAAKVAEFERAALEMQTLTDAGNEALGRLTTATRDFESAARAQAEHAERVGSLQAAIADCNRQIETSGLNPTAEDMEDARALAAAPTSVAMGPARLALLEAGLLSGVEDAINSLPEPDKTAAKIKWEYDLAVRRDDPLLIRLAQIMDLSPRQITDLFTAAARK